MGNIDYTYRFYDYAKKAGKKYSINPAIILAQASLESNWGGSYAARVRKNHFGITAYGSPNDYWSGEKSQSESSKLWFRIYKTDQDSFYDFARLIREKYPDSASVSYSIPDYAKSIANSPYISEKNGDNRPAYEKAIRDRAIQIDKEIKLIADVKKKNLYFKIAVIVLSLAIVGVATFIIIKSKMKTNVR